MSEANKTTPRIEDIPIGRRELADKIARITTMYHLDNWKDAFHQLAVDIYLEPEPEGFSRMEHNMAKTANPPNKLLGNSEELSECWRKFAYRVWQLERSPTVDLIQKYGNDVTGYIAAIELREAKVRELVAAIDEYADICCWRMLKHEVGDRATRILSLRDALSNPSPLSHPRIDGGRRDNN